MSLIAASPLADAHSLVTPSASATTEAAKLDNDSASKSGADESVYAEVYDQLGTSDASGAQAAFKLDSWRDSWKATPLLMILALERIAASNTRRTKENRPATPGGRDRTHLVPLTRPTPCDASKELAVRFGRSPSASTKSPRSASAARNFLASCVTSQSRIGLTE